MKLTKTSIYMHWVVSWAVFIAGVFLLAFNVRHDNYNINAQLIPIASMAVIALICDFFGSSTGYRMAQASLSASVILTILLLMGPVAGTLAAVVTYGISSIIFKQKNEPIGLAVRYVRLVGRVLTACGVTGIAVLFLSNKLNPLLLHAQPIIAVVAVAVFLFIMTLLSEEKKSLNGNNGSSNWSLLIPRITLTSLMTISITQSYELSQGLSPILAVVPAIVASAVNHFRLREMRTYRETIRMLGMMMQHAHPYSAGHLDRVAQMCRETALKLGLPDNDAELLYDAAILHDIGKIAVNETILNKAGRLSQEEWIAVKQHPTTGADVLGRIELFKPLSLWVSYHHERPDGKGYPYGLKGEEIPIQTRVISVVDAFDAMVGGDGPREKRSYASPKSIDEAIKELKRCSGTQFDPDVVNAFCSVVLEADE